LTVEIWRTLVKTEAPVAAVEQRQTRAPLFPFLDLKAQYAHIRDEVETAVTRVLESQQFILGPEVSALEQELVATLNTQFAIGCASGSDALLLALMALEIGPRDEVITPPFTFVATAGSIARLGAIPVFVDIDPDTFNLDPQNSQPPSPAARARSCLCICSDFLPTWIRSSKSQIRMEFLSSKMPHRPSWRAIAIR
jgi:histidinol-phosphate/aromatic aminotransferase/cobyric acid decarboxylase-like protein